MKQKRRILSLRMKGEDVQRLQAALGQIGFSIEDREGYFGKTTRQAVLTFQEKHDLEPSGIVDDETAELIIERSKQSAEVRAGLQLTKQKATLRRLGEVVGLSGEKVEAVLARATSPATLSDRVLASLVEAGEIEEYEAKDLGLIVSLHGLFDDDVELAETIKKEDFPQLPQGKVERIEDLVAFDKEDWLAVLTRADAKPPKGLKRKEYAALLAKRVENLYPSRALLARMMPKETKGLSEGIERLQPLFDKNEALFGAEGFDSLDVEGIDPGEVEELRRTHTQLKRFANAYPGLRLYEILDDRQLPAADKNARIRERVELLSRFQAQDPNVDFLSLDYAPDSADVRALDFAGFTSDEQCMVLSTLKVYQRVYSITHDAAHARRLLEMGHHSPLSIVNLGFEHFKTSAGLDGAVAAKYYDVARATVERANAYLKGLTEEL